MTDLLEPDPRRARLRLGVGAVLVIVLVGVAVAILVSALSPTGGTSVVSPGDGSSAAASVRDTASSSAADAAEASDAASASNGTEASSASSATATLIYVDVVGQVVTPGLYRLPPTDRIVDAIAVAGGFTASADRAALNLAQPLSDGQQLVVPAVGDPAPQSQTAAPGVPSATAKINLNTADATTLETLPRIGPAMAQRILDWRTAHHRFASVGDLQQITGIGPATFDALKPLVTV